MMFTAGSLVILALGTAAILLPNLRFGYAGREMTDRRHRLFCTVVFIIGCFVRFFKLDSLPEGAFAEEALLGVQAKALWQTGGFLFDGGLTTQLAQWAGESSGPLLATITAPFVGIFGMTPFVVRLPLALLSCAAMAAAYALGDALSGKRAGRWCLAAYALCPYFVLMARLACAANAAVFLLPITMLALVKGLDKPAMLYVGMVMTALLAYAQNMYFFISPAVIIIGCLIAMKNGVKKRHAFAAAGIGLLICLPAVLTLWVNLTGGDGFIWLGLVRVPKLEAFDKADALFDMFAPGETAIALQDKIWTVIAGAFFQILVHMNISTELFAPSGLGALYVLSIPLMLLGVAEVVNNTFSGNGKKYKEHAGRMLVIVFFVVTLFMVIVYGSVGLLNKEGASSVFDYSALLLFDVLMMVVGLCRMEKKSRFSITTLTVLFCACFVMQCTHLFGAGYRDNANVFFGGFTELSQKAAEEQAVSGAKVNVTGNVYPHIAPSDAAEAMYLYAADADFGKDGICRDVDYEIIFAPGIEEPNPEQIYLIAQGDATHWDFECYSYEELGEYILLTPIVE